MIPTIVIIYILFIWFISSQKSKVKAYHKYHNKPDKTYLLSYPGICSEQKHIQQICSKFEIARNHYNYTPKKTEQIYDYVNHDEHGDGPIDTGDEDDSIEDDYNYSHSGFAYYSIALLVFTSISMWLIYMSSDKPLRRYDGKILPVYT
jgi:hypothetical protein